MTGRFDTLIYTDCRPGQGLQGTAGLQFQARSPGAAAEAMALVQRALLYEPPASWMVARRPVADYPPSFAHIWDGYLATARGVYLGREVNGSREGNHLTHSVVTRDPAAYGLVRPAQLFGAPIWRSEPAEGTTCAEVEDGWKPGPLDAVSVQDFVRGQTDGVRLLGTLVTALEQPVEPGPRRLLFLAEDPEPVLRWLTAATLLVPQRRALEIGFKVFTTDPGYAVQQVLAVHPDWDSAPAITDRDSGYVVVDLVGHRWTEVPVSPTAATWAELFAAEDVYDVTDAVEISDASGLPPRAAQQLALAVVLGRRPAGEDTARIVSWLGDGPADLRDAYGGTLLDVLLGASGTLPLPTLRDLDRVTGSDHRRADRAPAVRLELVTAEVAAAGRDGTGRDGAGQDGAGRDGTGRDGAGRDGATTRVPPPPGWDETHDAAAQEIVARGLRAATGPRFDAVLRVAAAFAVPVPIGAVSTAVAAFVEDWVSHPDRPYDPSRWPDGSRFVAESTTEVRYRLAEQRLRAACGQPDPAGSVQRLTSVLWSLTPPTVAELERAHHYAAHVHAVIDPRIIDALLVAQRQAGGITAAAIDVCRLLRDDGLVQPHSTAALLADHDDRVRGFCRDLAVAAGPDTLDDLAGVSAEVMALHGAELADALYQATPTVARAVLADLPADILQAYAARLVSAVRGSRAAPGRGQGVPRPGARPKRAATAVRSGLDTPCGDPVAMGHARDRGRRGQGRRRGTRPRGQGPLDRLAGVGAARAQHPSPAPLAAVSRADCRRGAGHGVRRRVRRGTHLPHHAHGAARAVRRHGGRRRRCRRGGGPDAGGTASRGHGHRAGGGRGRRDRRPGAAGAAPSGPRLADLLRRAGVA